MTAVDEAERAARLRARHLRELAGYTKPGAEEAGLSQAPEERAWRAEVARGSQELGRRIDALVGRMRLADAAAAMRAARGAAGGDGGSAGSPVGG